MKRTASTPPLYIRTSSASFALAHNGIITNGDVLRKQYGLSKIQTDSYIAVQLVEYKNSLSADSLKFMAESVRESFSFSVIANDNTLYLVKGDSPMCILHFRKKLLYVYVSTEKILWKALIDTDLFDELKAGCYKKVPVCAGDILTISPDGSTKFDAFAYSDGYYSSFEFPYYGGLSLWDNGDSDEYIKMLKSAAVYEGYGTGYVDRLLSYGFTPEEIEECIYLVHHKNV